MAYIPPVPVPCGTPEVLERDAVYARVKITDSKAAFPALRTDLPVTFVYKYTKHTRVDQQGRKYTDTGWWPWVVIAESQVLKDYGIVRELGLYSWKGFKGPPPLKGLGMRRRVGEKIGNYREDANQVAALYGYENIVVDGAGKVSLDASKELNTDRRIEFASTERGEVEVALDERVKSDPGRWNKVYLLDLAEGGIAVYDGATPAHVWSYANYNASQSNMEVSNTGEIGMLRAAVGIDLNKSLFENRRSELTLNYGEDFWKHRTKTGAPPQRVGGARRPDSAADAVEVDDAGLYVEGVDSGTGAIEEIDASAARERSIVDVTIGAYIRKACTLR
jgi:hypothetical protein